VAQRGKFPDLDLQTLQRNVAGGPRKCLTLKDYCAPQQLSAGSGILIAATPCMRPPPPMRAMAFVLALGAIALCGCGGSAHLPLDATAGPPAAGPASAAGRLNTGEAPFLVENEAAMSKMMAAMAVKPGGDVDKDFVATMVPHHQGAIEMAQAELRHGHNEQLRRIAQEIIVDQTQEIAAMRLALGQPLPPAAVTTGASR